MNGTSVATAKVTGAAFEVWAANPELNYRQVIDILKSTATDLKTPNPDLETGSGLVNMAAAIPLAKATESEAYNPELQIVAMTWSGEGKVTPMERAVNYSYHMKYGDTLWGIAQRELGSGNRWTEITKDAAGTQPFTSEEASQLPIGQVVYLPGDDPNPQPKNPSQPEIPTQPSQDQVKQTALSNFLNAFGNVQSASFSDFLKEMFENFYSNPGETLNSQAPEQGTGNISTASFTTTATQSPNTLAGKKIILDPGHGITNTGFDPGAGGNGTTEAKENLHQANLIANHLRSLGAEVKVIDEALSLAQIGQRAAGHDIFVSLHQNAFN
jgi:N-acetylmuramoyl-L-alanine amidase